MVTALRLGVRWTIVALGLLGTLATTAPTTAAEPDAGAPPRLAPPMRTSIAVDRQQFKEGWKQTVQPKPLSGRGDVYELAVENGWLRAKRSTADGQLEWQMFLARVVEGELPVISTVGSSSFELSYRDGRYFIRDVDNLLRRRARAPPAEQAWPRASALAGDARRMGRGRASLVDCQITAWGLDDWFFATSGHDDERLDAIVRLNPIKKQPPGYGFETRPLFARCFHGDDTWIIDDGELLLATRTTTSQYEAERALELRHQAITGGGPLPKLDATDWINAPEPLSWEALRGKVVLVDFWGVWCGPCVKKLPEVQKFAEKYGPRGVVVIGIHSAQDGESCRAFVEKQGLTFPIAIDSGKTAEAFGIEAWPSVFLIDRTGKVITAYENGVPADDVVEKLLD